MSFGESKKPKIEIDLTIMDLSNDCLISIFNELRASDLVSVYECCKYFQPAAEYCFSKRYSEMKLCHIFSLGPSNSPYKRKIPSYCYFMNYRLAEANIHWYDENSVKYNIIFKAIRYFGIYLKKINFVQRMLNGSFPILKAASIYCGENLKSLQLGNFEVDDITRIDEIGNLFKRVEKLCVDLLDSANFEKILDHCVNLKELRTVNVVLTDSILQRTFRNLEKFEFIRPRYGVHGSTSFNKFLKNHPNLKYINVGDLLLGTTARLNLLENIEAITLDLYSNQIDWVKLFQMPKLKTIKLYINGLLIKIPSGITSSIESIDLGVHRFEDAT